MQNERRREDGSALLVAVLLLVFMGLIGLAAMDTVTRDREVAGFTKRTRIAFYAAEAGAHVGLDLISSNPNKFNPPVISTTNLGQAADYPNSNQPQYTADTVNSPCGGAVCFVREVPKRQGDSLGGGTQGRMVAYWQVNAQGNGPNGGQARVEASKRLRTFAGYGN